MSLASLEFFSISRSRVELIHRNTEINPTNEVKRIVKVTFFKVSQYLWSTLYLLYSRVVI